MVDGTPGGRLFVGWLDDCGRSFATTLDAWVRRIFPGVDVLLASDVRKDSQWWVSLPQTAHGADAAMLCVIGQQVSSPWLHLQLGVCFRSVPAGRPVVPVLLDIEPDELGSTPLGMFQGVRPTEQDFSVLVGDLARSFSLDEHGTDGARSRSRAAWPELLERLDRVPGPSVGRAFQVVLVLPDAIIPIPNSASVTDEEWASLVRRTSAVQKFPGFTLRPFSVADLTPLDLAREEWMRPPQLVSRLRTRNVALVHDDVRERYGDEAKAVSKLAKLHLARTKTTT